MKNSKRFNSSGQVLLVAVSLGVILAVAVAIGSFVTHSAFRQAASAEMSAGRTTADEGIAHAMRQLSKTNGIWQNALQGTFSGTDCNTDAVVKSPSGNLFKLYCSRDAYANPKLQVYQVAVKSIALSPTQKPLRAMRAYLSKRTLGADIAPNIHAAAGIQLVRQPPVEGNPAGYWLNTLDVHWGPIVNLNIEVDNPDSWWLREPLDSQRYPRKFTAGGLGGPTFGRSTRWTIGGTTDEKEYWTFANMSIPPSIDEEAYRVIASSFDLTTGPRNRFNQEGGSTPRYSCGTDHPNCAIFKPLPGDFAFFDGNGLTGNKYTVPSGAVIVVMGSALFRNVSIDNATVIIENDLVIAPSVAGFTANTLNLHVPVTAPLEYPYGYTSQSSLTWPCKGKEGNTSTGGNPAYDCGSDNVFTTGGVNFRGFLYVKNHLNASGWALFNMVGSLLVGDMQAPPGNAGRLNINSDSVFNFAYDDIINHNILVKPVSGSMIRLVTDQIQEVPL